MYQISVGNTVLRLIREDDAEFILRLRLDGSVNRFLSPVDADLAKQVEWISQYKQREAIRSEFYFVIENPRDQQCGTVRVYDFQGTSFSWGSWIVAPGSPSFAAIESAFAVYEFAFGHLGFLQSHFEVRKGNAKVLKFHQRFGATIVREDDLNLYFHLSRASYEKTKAHYARTVPLPAVLTTTESLTMLRVA